MSIQQAASHAEIKQARKKRNADRAELARQDKIEKLRQTINEICGECSKRTAD